MDQKKPEPPKPVQASVTSGRFGNVQAALQADSQVSPPMHHESQVQHLLHGHDYSAVLQQAADALKQLGNELATGLQQLNKTLETLKQSAPVQAPVGHQPPRAPRIDDAPDSPKF